MDEAVGREAACEVPWEGETNERRGFDRYPCISEVARHPVRLLPAVNLEERRGSEDVRT